MLTKARLIMQAITNMVLANALFIMAYSKVARNGIIKMRAFRGYTTQAYG